MKISLEDIRTFCLSLPLVTEDVKWGADLCFNIGKKMFCVTGLEEKPVGITIKVKDEDFEEIISNPGFRPADYLARYKWVTLDDINKISKKELERLIRQSYELIKAKVPKKLLQ